MERNSRFRQTFSAHWLIRFTVAASELTQLMHKEQKLAEEEIIQDVIGADNYRSSEGDNCDQLPNHQNAW